MAQYPSCGKIQDGGGRHIGNTQTGIFRPLLDRFAPNFVCGYILNIGGSPGAENYTHWKFKISEEMNTVCILFSAQIGITIRL